MKRVLMGGVVAAVAILVTAPSAFACSCAEDPETKETLHGYDAAATARLVDVKNKDPQTGSADLVYKITRVYKNRNLREDEKLVIRQSGGGASCGLPRDKKKRYGLRLYRDRDDRLSSDSCAILDPKELRRAAERSGNARSAGTISCDGTAS